MKHTIELKMPRLFGKKSNKPEVTTEIDLENNTNISTGLLIGGVLTIGITAGYFVGFRAGVGKGGTHVTIVK